jgi:hypothetical protein
MVGKLREDEKMLAEQWVNDTLESKINENGNIQLSESQEVEILTFCVFFRDGIENDTQPDKYVALSGSHTFLWGVPSLEYTRSAEELGYQSFFDQWHEEGVI